MLRCNLAAQVTQPPICPRTLHHRCKYRRASPRPARGVQVALRQRNGIEANAKLEILTAEKDLYVARVDDK